MSCIGANIAALLVAADSSPSFADWLSAGAEAVTALSVGFLFWQIKAGKNNAKAERTSALQEHYMSDGFAKSASRTVGCAKVRDAGDCVRVIKAWSNRGDARKEVLPQRNGDDKAAVQDVAKTLGFFEDMGTAYKLKQLDKRNIQRSFAKPTVHVFVTAWWLICWQRKGLLGGEEEENGHKELAYVEFEDMCHELLKAKKFLKVDPELQICAAVRSLCLPKGHGDPLDDDRAWEDSRRLSLALSALIGSAEKNGGVAAALADLAGSVASMSEREPSADSGWEVLLVPPSIDQRCDRDWKGQRAAAGELALSLSRVADPDALDEVVRQIEARVG